MQPADVAAAFVARINAHDVAALGELMTDDHLFVDGLNNEAAGREAMQARWTQYFALVPDYWIQVETVLHEDATVALFGKAGGTYAGDTAGGQAGRWEAPAAWLAQVRDGRVAKWRVYADNLPLRRLMGLEET
jgi:ketosteroid isomerase-like protein